MEMNNSPLENVPTLDELLHRAGLTDEQIEELAGKTFQLDLDADTPKIFRVIQGGRGDDEEYAQENNPVRTLHRIIYGDEIDAFKMKSEDMREFTANSRVGEARFYYASEEGQIWLFIGACRRIFADNMERLDQISILVTPASIYMFYPDFKDEYGEDVTYRWLASVSAEGGYKFSERDIWELLKLAPEEFSQYYTDETWHDISQFIRDKVPFRVNYNLDAVCEFIE